MEIKRKKREEVGKTRGNIKKDYFLIKRYVNVACIGLEQDFIIKIEKEKY